MDNIYWTYVNSLAKLNEKLITPGVFPGLKVFNALSWGLIEEYYEYAAADFTENKIKEAGDTLAYITLLLLSYNSVNDTADLLHLLDLGSFSKNMSLLEYCSNLKRLNREDETFNWAAAVALFKSVFDDVKTYFVKVPEIGVINVSFDIIATVNIEKLTYREERSILFSGAGDNR
jgi:hypothetical protein